MPETTENYHHIPVRDSGDFVDDSMATITISEDQGIKAVIGKLKSNSSGSTKIQKYMFDVNKWSMAEAEKWVAEHKKRSGPEKRSFDTRIAYSKEDKNEVHLRGLAIPYGKLSDNPITGMSQIKERILPGAFKKSLESKRDVMMLWNHELKYIFGRTSRGTLELNETDEGINFHNVPPESNWAKDLLPSIKRGDYANMSFSFSDDVEPEMTLENGDYVRNVKQATLFEISLVPYAVYETTSVGMRSSDFMIVDGIALPDPSAVERRAMEDIEQFRKVEDQFNNLKKDWL